MKLTEEDIWKIYNFVNDWKAGMFGVIEMEKAIENIDINETDPDDSTRN